MGHELNATQLSPIFEPESCATAIIHIGKITQGQQLTFGAQWSSVTRRRPAWRAGVSRRRWEDRVGRKKFKSPVKPCSQGFTRAHRKEGPSFPKLRPVNAISRSPAFLFFGDRDNRDDGDRRSYAGGDLERSFEAASERAPAGGSGGKNRPLRTNNASGSSATPRRTDRRVRGARAPKRLRELPRPLGSMLISENPGWSRDHDQPGVVRPAAKTARISREID